MKPEILLINPTYMEKTGNVWKEIASCLPPLGLASVAAYLESKGHSVAILDAEASRLDLKTLAASAAELNPVFIGITATTPMIRSALDIADACKRAAPGARIILGGVHASVLPEEVLRADSVDYAVRGEGEITCLEIVEGRDPAAIKGLSYKSGGKIVHNPARELIEDINTLPFPAFHLLPMDKYYPAKGSYKRLPAISLIISRGCPGKCTFCYPDRLGKKIRMLSAAKTVEMINLLKRDYGIREVCFYDDTFTLSRTAVREMCGLMIDQKLGLTWSCFSRVDFMDEQTLALMKSSGCHQICYGIESGDEGILKALGKQFTLEKASSVVALTKKIGIEARTAFMFGSPGETRETLEKTLEYCIRLDPDYAIFNITTPYPGTQIFEWAKSKGILLTEDWEKFDVSTPVMRLPTLSPEDLVAFYKHAYKKFYTRPKYILKNCFRVTSFGDFVSKFTTFLKLVKMAAVKGK